MSRFGYYPDGRPIPTLDEVEAVLKTKPVFGNQEHIDAVEQLILRDEIRKLDAPVSMGGDGDER